MSLRRLFCVLPAAVALVALGSSAAAAGPWSLAPGEYSSELRGSFYSASSFYDDNGDRLQRNGLYESRALTSYTELGWTKHVSAQLGLPAVSTTLRSNAPQGAATRTALGDFSLGLRWSLHNAASAAALQLQWQAPTGYNRQLQPAPGTGLQKLSALLEFGRPLGSRGFVQLGGGYRYDYRKIGSTSADAPDWSSHAVVDGALAIWLGHVQVAGLYQGLLPVGHGLATEVTEHLAGTRFTCRVDDRLDAFAGSWHTASGKNVLHVDQFYAGLNWKLTKLNRLQGFLGGDKRP